MFRGAGNWRREANQRIGTTGSSRRLARPLEFLLRAEGAAVGLVQLVLKGKLRGYGVGLVQLMRDWPCPQFPCPDVFARHLLELVLEDFRETGHHYLMHLVAERDHARRRGTPEEVSALDEQIHEHAIHEQIPPRWRDHARRRGTPEEVSALEEQIHEHAIFEQIPQRWHLDFLFSQAGYAEYGDAILPFWATALIQLCTLEQHWEGALLGLPPRKPHVLAGFHSDRDVFDTAWLQGARRTWLEKVRAPSAAEPDEREDEELHVHLEPESAAAGPGTWVN